MLAVPVSALNATYQVLPDGTSYDARVDLVNQSSYSFEETGALGEKTAVAVTNISLAGDCSPCTFNRTGGGGLFSGAENSIEFPRGNYTVLFQGPVKDNHMLLVFDQPYNVSIILPDGLNVKNFLLGYVSSGGQVSSGNNTTMISWKNSKSAEIRFYDRGREELLYLFGNFWIVIAVVLLVPYFLTRRKK